QNQRKKRSAHLGGLGFGFTFTPIEFKASSILTLVSNPVTPAYLPTNIPPTRFQLIDPIHIP
ncbi:MAG TPA: hypothetical protein PK643_16660, partial [Saprospiraceae bacterium]|nr:hypothetical protein [Saprospiraceae bacterium]